MIAKRINELYQHLNDMSGQRLGVLTAAFKSFSGARGADSAASLAYYALFSLFPLLILFVAVGSYFLDGSQVYSIVTDWIQGIIPVSTQLINENLREVLNERETFGIIGLAALVWAASGVFTNLAYNINLGWPQSSRRSFLQKRLIGLAMIIGVSALLIVSVMVRWLSNVLAMANPTGVPFLNLNLWGLFSGVSSWLMVFVLFVALYRWAPTAHVSWTAGLWGAAFSSLVWKIAIAGFSWYVTSGFGRYQLVYGSLGALVALLFLIYIMSAITLFGAHLSAATDDWLQHHKQVQAAQPSERRVSNEHVEPN